MSWRSTGVSLATLVPGTTRELLLGPAMVLLSRVGPLVFATDAVCPHEGGLLSEGNLSGRRVTCPVHNAIFDVGDGSVLADPFGIEPPQGGVPPLARYPTRTIDGVVEVDLPDRPSD